MPAADFGNMIMSLKTEGLSTGQAIPGIKPILALLKIKFQKEEYYSLNQK